MPAYIVSRVKIHDMERMQEYMRAAPPIVQSFGGRYMVRGNSVEALEGEWDCNRMVVVEFPTREAALAWYHSAEYRPLRELRQKCAETVILLADGMPATV